MKKFKITLIIEDYADDPTPLIIEDIKPYLEGLELNIIEGNIEELD